MGCHRKTVRDKGYSIYDVQTKGEGGGVKKDSNFIIQQLLRTVAQVRCSPSPASFLEVGLFLKIRNRESQFLLPDREMRNWDSENSLPIPSKCAKNGQGIGIAIL